MSISPHPQPGAAGFAGGGGRWQQRWGAQPRRGGQKHEGQEENQSLGGNLPWLRRCLLARRWLPWCWVPGLAVILQP